MVSLADDQAPDDRRLSRYLIGSLADEEMERLDELSVVDDEFASRLSAAENDLVDAYVRGQLSGETLTRFESHYLSSPARREKVRFAETLHAYQSRAASATAQSTPRRRWLVFPDRVPRWGFAAVALVVLAAAGYLLLDNLRLRSLMNESRAARASLEEGEQQLQRQLMGQQAATADTAKELARVRESLAQLEARATMSQQGDRTAVLSFVLAAPTRGAADIPTLAIPAGTDAVRLRLELEADDFPRYRVALRDPARDRIIWRGDNVRPTAGGDAKALSITLNAGLLRPQIYRVEITGVPARDIPGLVSGYSFRVVPR
jgi:hypothetical protein